MKRAASLAWSLLAGSFILGAAAAPAGAAAQPSPPLVRIMPLGDSITQGEGSTATGGYRGPLWESMARQSAYAADFVGSGRQGGLADGDHEGHSGWTIAGVRSGIDRWQAGASPDVVLLHLGINDLKHHGADPEAAARQLLELVDRMRANNPYLTVLVQGLITDTPGQEGRTEAFNAYVRGAEPERQAAGQRFRYLAPPTMDVATDLPDRLHPSESGYRKMAAVFRPAIDRAVSDGWAQRPRVGRSGNESGADGRARWADFDGDGKPDHVTIADDGKVSVRLNRGGASRGGWEELGQVAFGTTNDRRRVRLADYDGDGRFDYLVVNANGSISAWINKGGDKPGQAGWQEIGQVATGLTTDPTKVRFADWDGDGRTDYVLFNEVNNVDVWLNRGGDTAGTAGWTHIGRVTTATHDRNRVRFADNDGDNRADYHLVKPDGKVDLYRNRGGDTVGSGGWETVGQIATGVTEDHTSVQIADFTGDHHADYIQRMTNGASAVYAWNGGDVSGPNGWTPLGDVTSD
ncbi:FG-GAP-like repeat-containing protein [Streptomyces sp. NPDC055254]